MRGGADEIEEVHPGLGLILQDIAAHLELDMEPEQEGDTEDEAASDVVHGEEGGEDHADPQNELAAPGLPNDMNLDPQGHGQEVLEDAHAYENLPQHQELPQNEGRPPKAGTAAWLRSKGNEPVCPGARGTVMQVSLLYVCYMSAICSSCTVHEWRI